MDYQKKDFYVYCHQKKDDGRCFYIGKGKDDRAYSEIGRNIHWKRTIAKHGGFDVVILVNNITEEKAFELEKEFIRQIGRENLVNMTDGGEGSSGRIPSEETRIKIKISNTGKTVSFETRKKQSESHIGLMKGNKHPMYGKSPSEQTRRKRSESMKGKMVGDKHPLFGKHLSDEHKRKQSESMKGKMSGDKNPMYGKCGKDHHSSKKVDQYSISGEYIKTWDSIRDVVRELKIQQSNVSRCCLGQRKSAGGFLFKFA